MSNFEKKIDEAAEYLKRCAQQQREKRRMAPVCSACGGTGWGRWGMGKCPRCHGRGRVGRGML